MRGVYDFSCYFDRYNGNIYAHYFGVAPYTNFQVYKGLFLHVEDEVMYGLSRWNHQTSRSQWFNTVFVGGGYRQYSYSGSYIYYMLLYNLSWGVMQSQNAWDTPYSSPIEIRIGFCF